VPVGLDPNDPRAQSAAFAELIEDFWKSDIGQYLAGRARKESEEATRELVENAHEMTVPQRVAAQAKIWRATKFGEWLEEAYVRGCADLEILKEEHDGAGT
jgi:hypothetical protein